MKDDIIKISSRKVEYPRFGWQEAFALMAKNGDDKLIIQDNIDLDWQEWQW